MGRITNDSGVDDAPSGWRTYYVEITVAGCSYYKVGHTNRSVARRFAEEPEACSVRILNIWPHTTEAKCLGHEERLLRTKGDRPFIGKMGPLSRGGNTEVYTHDVLNGAPGPETFKVVRIDKHGHRDILTVYVDYDPYEPFAIEYAWVADQRAPSFPALLVRERCDANKITVVSADFAAECIERPGLTVLSRRAAQAAIDEGFYVSTYAEAYAAVNGPSWGSGWLPSR